ncbi:mechanosensitive ion channel domain-containing protein [Roseiconus lacunae]|uniref:mechanosensitive ion channel domain-containing protein n=1 Tax=Roseiconus lacunae TaxID=2605694 RepID=UPI001F23B852|nr:mechanosensitive ion channel domain-containing protein [Roseiconus lacunae]
MLQSRRYAIALLLALLICPATMLHAQTARFQRPQGSESWIPNPVSNAGAVSHSIGSRFPAPSGPSTEQTSQSEDKRYANPFTGTLRQSRQDSPATTVSAHFDTRTGVPSRTANAISTPFAAEYAPFNAPVVTAAGVRVAGQSTDQPVVRLARPRTSDREEKGSGVRLAASTEIPVQSKVVYTRAMVDSARQSESHFQRIAAGGPNLVSTVATENARFAKLWADLAEECIALAERVETAQAKLRSTQQDYDDVTAKIEKYGLTPTIGILLRHKKEQLDRWQANDSQTGWVHASLQKSREAQLDLELVPFDGTEAAIQASEVLSQAGFDPNKQEQQTLRSNIEQLLSERAEWLAALWAGHRHYQEQLTEIDAVTSASSQLTRDYRKLINRHVVWIRSGETIGWTSFGKLRPGLASLMDSDRGSEFGFSLQQKLGVNLASGIVIALLTVGLLVLRWWAKSILVGIGSKTRLRESTKSTRKLAGCGLTVLVACLLPAVFLMIARWLGSGYVSESLLQASSGFYACSLIALMVELPRQLLRDYGIVDKHLGIDLPRRQRACQYLMVVGTGLVLSAYVVTVTGLIDQGMWRESVSRIGLIITLLLVAWTFHRALHPTKGILEPIVAKYGGSMIHRIRVVLYLFAIGSPLAIAFLSAIGYGFTAQELILRFAVTFSLALICATLWPAVKILAAHVWRVLTGGQSPQRKFDEYGEIEPTHEIDLSGGLYLDLKHQIAFLCQCGLVVAGMLFLGYLWIDVFPNLRTGNPVVWTVQETVTKPIVNANGQTVMQASVEEIPVTLVHVFFAAVTLFVAFQVAKLLPALFDALVLQRVSFDEGMEHFSLVLGRCILFGVGCLIALNWLGVRWQTVQWLAVGLTIGLGFGLQDMVRNVFGGLVVLFEKPASLGDLITIGRITGRVAKQHLRTTVLTDDDGRENIIPNKKFVTDDVVNWMGAGRLTVIPIEVAVTKDERPADICRTLQEFAAEQENVLVAPAPQATLVCISKHSQRIEIRVWIEDGKLAVAFRNDLLKRFRKYLGDLSMLVKEQPEQPVIRDLAKDQDLFTKPSRRSA